MKRRFVLSTEDRLLVVILGVLFVVSVGIPVYEEVFGTRVPASWNAPVVLLALFAIIRLVGPLPQIGKDVRYLREIADVGVQRMPTVKDFYDSLMDGLAKAETTLDLTHIRDHPPADFGPGASEFFTRLVDWCMTEQGRSIRRIISVRNVAMYEWALALAEQVADLPQFEIRVIDWAPRAPALNMAIIDERAVYLALTGSTITRTRGLGIEDQKTAQYFRDYYETLWGSSTDLQDWLAKNSIEGD